MGPLAPTLTSRLLVDLFSTPRPRPLDQAQLEALAAGDRFRIPHAGGHLDAWSYGRGPTVLLAHGWAGRGAQLHPFIVPLMARGYRVVLFDGPAHGGSSGRTTNIGDFARAIASALEALDDVYAIVAHSMGGGSSAVALSLYAEEPERLVFIAPPIHPSTWIAQFRELLDLSDELNDRLVVEIERRLQFRLDDVHGEKMASAMHAALLVIHDRDDRQVPHASGRKIAEAWPGARLITTEGLGHNRILRDPTVIDAAVRFVAGEENGK